MKTKVAEDHYEPHRMFRRAIFDVALDFADSRQLTEREVCECLKECLEFFWAGASHEVVRDFCIVKVRRADNAQTEEGRSFDTNSEE